MKPWIVILASSNAHKVTEITRAFEKKWNTTFHLKPMNAYPQAQHLKIVEDGSTFYENALIKAKKTYEALAPFFEQQVLGTLADDSGLCVSVLRQEPGIFSARYGLKDLSNHPHSRKDIVLDQDAMNRKKLTEELEKTPQYIHHQQQNQKEIFLTKAHFETTMVFFSGKSPLKTAKETIIQAKGTLEGHVSNVEKGNQGFGYDSLFFPKGEKRTLAQMSLEEKNVISHRTQALEKMLAKLNDFFSQLAIIEKNHRE